MTASSKRRRNRTIAALLSGVLVLGSAPLLGFLGWQVLKDSKAGTEVETLDEIAFPSTPTAMLAVVDDQNLVVSLAVMVMAPSPATGEPARGGTLVSIPTNANRAQSTTDPTLPVADSMINAGEEGLLADVESLTRVTLNYDAVLGADDLTALLTPVGDVSATLPNDVVTGGADGSTETLFVAGATDLTPAESTSVLLARDPSRTEAQRLPNTRAVWSALATKVAAGIEPAAPLAAEITTFDDFMAHFLAGPVQVYHDLDTKPITGSSNPDQLDVGSIDITSVVLLMASLAPSAMITPNPTLNFRIENGVTQADIDAAGLVGVTPADVTRDLVARLLFLQGNVVSVSSAVYTLESKVTPDTTAVLTENGLEPAELEAITELLGDVEFDSLPFTFPLVDVVIVIGRTYLTDMARVQALGSGETDSTTGATSETTGDTTGGSTTDTSTPPVEPTDTVTS